MNELAILHLFYDEMRLRGVTRDQVYLDIEGDAAALLTRKLNETVSIQEAQKYADICIANEWLERTTADPYYKYLSLTEAGLQIVLNNQYL